VTCLFFPRLLCSSLHNFKFPLHAESILCSVMKNVIYPDQG